MTTTTHRDARPVAASAAVLGLIDRGRDTLLEACHASSAAERYESAHLAALRITAALLAARRPPARRRPSQVWPQLRAVAPELGEWATFFAGSARMRAHLAAGTATVTAREADDLVRQCEMFLERVLAALGLPMCPPISSCVTPVTTSHRVDTRGHRPGTKVHQPAL